MRQTIGLCIILSISLLFSMANARDNNRTLPSVDVKTLKGKMFNTKNIQNDGKPILITFFISSCKLCDTELSTINELYDEWQEETGVVVYAISVDDSRTAAKVAPYIVAKNIDFIVLQDINSDFKRTMNIGLLPYMCLLNGECEIVWSHNSYSPGYENEIFNIIKKVAKKENINN